MLDSIVQETARLRQSLGPADNVILDEYLTNVRDVEQQLDRMHARADQIPEGTSAPLGLPDNFDDHMTVTYDLMHLAFQGDISRVFTFAVGTRAAAAATRTSAFPSRITRSRITATSRRTSRSTPRSRRITSMKLAQFIEKLKTTPTAMGRCSIRR
jgi:hypothetical protein